VALPPDFTLLQVVPELETGGAELSALEVSRAVVRAGGRSLVASRGGRMARQLQADGGELVALPLATKNPLRILANGARLARLIRREKVSLVHARSRAPAFSALWAARATGVPFVATYHGIYKARSAAKRWVNAVMTRGELVIANSEYTRRHVLAEHGLAEDRVVTIPRGVDLDRYDPDKVAPERIAALRQAWGIEPDDRRTKVLLAGRLTRIKGQLVVVEAMKRLAVAGRRDLLVLFAGDDQGRSGYAGELRQAIAEAGLQDDVRLVGHCSDMPAAYLLADVAILPTTVPESFGRAAVEPQAMGRPVIASAHGGAVETVAEGITGWLAAPGDAGAWAQALARAADAGLDVRTRMGQDAMTRARALYRTDAMCEATLQAYERVLEARG
jgi:glycosyltransferase involved in cell wall biosynthesis